MMKTLEIFIVYTLMKADTGEDCLKYVYIISKTYNRLLLSQYKNTLYQLPQNYFKLF